jgi:hypothetical protein
MGAVPFQDAKCPRLAERLTSAMSPRPRSAAGADAVSLLQAAAGGFDHFGQLPIGFLRVVGCCSVARHRRCRPCPDSERH